MIKEGDIVTPIRGERLRFMNLEFKQWIEDNLGKRFYVERTTETACKLAKVFFLVSRDFLEKT